MRQSWKLYFRKKETEEIKTLVKTLINSGQVIRAYYIDNDVVQISVLLGEV